MQNKRKTKIVCTLGPAVSTPQMMRGLLRAGMDVARFNFSHADHDAHQAMFTLFDETRRELGIPAAAMLDTRGPEVRTGVMQGGKIRLEAGGRLILTPREVEGTPERIQISHPSLANDVQTGNLILIDDGLIALQVEEIRGDEIVCRVQNSGFVSNRKGINIPGVRLSMPYLSERDISDILFGVQLGFDYIAASFVTCAEDVLSVRRLLDSEKCRTIGIIAKIESASGVEQIDDILRVSDGIMVARGDLGVEIPFEEVPVVQKALIKKALSRCKTVITATQMLDSMTAKPRPTRAEAADVANAIYDGTSAVMLSGETAAGQYPLEAVEAMAAIALRAEHDINYKKRLEHLERSHNSDPTYAIAHATCTIADDLGAAAILPVTCSGYTARMISSFRPGVPIIGCTPSEATCRHLSLVWGVTPVLMDEHPVGGDEMLSEAVAAARARGLLEEGQTVVLTAGMPIGIPGTTNLIKVDMVGDVLATGRGIGKSSATGRLCVAATPEEALSRFRDGDILVIPKTEHALLALLRRASGIVAEEDGTGSHAAIIGLTLDIPTLIGVADATSLLRSGINARLDAARGRLIRTGGKTGAPGNASNQP